MGNAAFRGRRNYSPTPVTVIRCAPPAIGAEAQVEEKEEARQAPVHVAYNHGVSIGTRIEGVTMLQAVSLTCHGSSSKPTVVLGPATSERQLVLAACVNQAELRIGVVDLPRYLDKIHERALPGHTWHSRQLNRDGIVTFLSAYGSQTVNSEDDDTSPHLTTSSSIHGAVALTLREGQDVLQAEVVDDCLWVLVNDAFVAEAPLPNVEYRGFAVQFHDTGDIIAIGTPSAKDKMGGLGRVIGASHGQWNLARRYHSTPSDANSLDVGPVSDPQVSRNEELHEELREYRADVTGRGKEDYTLSSRGVVFDLITRGAIRLVHARYFADMVKSGRTLETRQVIEEKYGEYYWPAVEALKLWSNPFSGFTFVAVSYAWGEQGNPDRFGHLCRRMAEICTKLAGNTAVFMDFMSLYQWPRTDAQDELFKIALSGMDCIYAHAKISVLKLTSSSVPGAVSYFERGWPYLESCLADAKPGGTANVYEFPEEWVSDSPWEMPDMLKGRRPPVHPRKFEECLAAKIITNKADQKKLVQLYKCNFGALVNGNSLCFQQVGWGPEEAGQLASVLPYFLHHLRALNLSSNRIGDHGVCVLSCVLPHIPELQSLELNYNFIGDEGALALKLVMPQSKKMVKLNLSGNAIGDVGARSFLEVVPPSAQFKLLILRTNHISAEMKRTVLANVARQFFRL